MIRCFALLALGGCVATPSPPACGVRPLEELNSDRMDRGPWLSPDRLEVFFYSERSGGMGGSEIYRATRSSASDPFQPPQRVSSIATDQDESWPFVSNDGRRLYWVHNSTELSVAERTARDAPFMGTKIVNTGNAAYPEHPSLSPNELEVYVGDATTSSFDVFVARRPAIDQPFGNRETIPLSDERDSGPSISSDGQTLLFDTRHFTTDNTTRIARAKRAGLGFGSVVELGETDPQAGYSDVDPQLHRPSTAYPDETIVFASDRPGGKGDFDLWIACE